MNELREISTLLFAINLITTFAVVLVLGISPIVTRKSLVLLTSLGGLKSKILLSDIWKSNSVLTLLDNNSLYSIVVIVSITPLVLLNRIIYLFLKEFLINIYY